MNSIKYICLLILLVVFAGCGNQPEVIQPTNHDLAQPNKQSTDIFSTNDQRKTTNATSPKEGVHEVVVLDVLPTDKYVYLEVKEDEEKYWVATRKQDVKKGQRYFFKGGLLKTNFESKEYDRIFDKVYLVSNIVPLNHGQGEEPPAKTDNETSIIKSVTINNPKEGSIKISEILANPKKYEGKAVQVTGQCVKLNPNIMGRNWIHLKDGSKDDYDFVLTSEKAIPEGHVVTLSGVVSLNKDFGAGYRYDIIVEQADIVH